MVIFNILTLLVVITAIFAYVNTRFIKLPNTIGLMLISFFSSILIGLGKFYFPEVLEPLIHTIVELDFSVIVLNIMLSFLLFAGAMHTDFDLLKTQRRSIILFSVTGVVLSSFFIGGILYYIAGFFGFQIPFIYCLLFGSFISPTDPIAVLGILTKTKIPKNLEINIVGESLFNDGIGVVIFITILTIIQQGLDNVTGLDIAILFAKEAIGGLLFGFILGTALYFLMKSVDDYETEVILSIAAVMGGTFIAFYLHISAPLAMVVAGLMTGHKTREAAMSDTTQLYVEKFWHLLDVLLNALLFVLMGMEVLVVQFEWSYVMMSALLIPLFILARYLALFIPLSLTSKFIPFHKRDLTLMAWGGLRGGLSIAMALSLSNDIPYRNLFVSLTFGIVLFSIFIQGLTVQPLVKKLYK